MECKINEKKSKVLQVRRTQKPEEICGLEVVDEIRYLGVKLGGRRRNIFREEKISWEKKAQTCGIQVISQVGRSYDKVTVGKTMWKQMFVAGLLFGRAVVTTSKNNIGLRGIGEIYLMRNNNLCII